MARFSGIPLDAIDAIDTLESTDTPTAAAPARGPRFGGIALETTTHAVAAAPRDLRADMRQKFPWTSGVDVNVIDSSAKGDASGTGRRLEFYPGDERDNPEPGKPTIEVFDKSMTASDLMGEVLSHHLTKTDPVVANYRSQILASMTPDQKEGIRHDFDRQKKSGLVGGTFNAWLQKQGGDSFFRGLPTGQWKSDEYTPQQKALYADLDGYLQSKVNGGSRPDRADTMPAGAAVAPAPPGPNVDDKGFGSALRELLGTASAVPARPVGVGGVDPRYGQHEPMAAEHGEIAKGFIGGLVGTNPKMLGSAMDAVGILADSPKIRAMGQKVEAFSDEQLKQYQPAVGSVADVGSASDAAKYAGYQVGQGVSSTLPSLAVGSAAALVTANPIVGLAVGAAGPSYIQNLGDVHSTIRDEMARTPGVHISEKQAALAAVIAAVPMAALDTVGVGKIGASFMGPAREAFKKALIRRVVEEAAKDAGVEGMTEAAQEVISQFVSAKVSGNDVLTKDRMVSVLDNFIAGALTGGVVGGAGAATHAAHGEAVPAGADTVPQQAEVAPPPPQDAAPDFHIATDEEQAAAAAAPELLPQAAQPKPGPLTSAVNYGAQKAIEEVARRAGAKEPSFVDGFGDEDALGAEPAAPIAAAETEKTALPSALSNERPEIITPTTETEPVAPIATGERHDPVRIEDVPADLTAARERVAEPTEAQIEAGNYRKGHVKVQGLDITIENPVGSERSGVDPNGKPWSVKMPADYGYIKRTVGADNEQIDVYLGHEPHAHDAFIVDQVDAKTGKFDEHKIIMGVPDEAAARNLYEAGFSDGKGPARMGALTRVTIPELKEWLTDGDTKKPVADGSSAAALKWYQATGYAQVNRFLREGTFPNKVQGANRQKADAAIEALKAAAKPIPRPTVVYRGMREQDLGRDDGFVSVTTDPSIAHDHARKDENGIVIQMTLPKGTLVTALPGGESEYVLMPGTTISEVKRAEKGMPSATGVHYISVVDAKIGSGALDHVAVAEAAPQPVSATPEQVEDVKVLAAKMRLNLLDGEVKRAAFLVANGATPADALSEIVEDDALADDAAFAAHAASNGVTNGWEIPFDQGPKSEAEPTADGAGGPAAKPVARAKGRRKATGEQSDQDQGGGGEVIAAEKPTPQKPKPAELEQRDRTHEEWARGRDFADQHGVEEHILPDARKNWKGVPVASIHVAKWPDGSFAEQHDYNTPTAGGGSPWSGGFETAGEARAAAVADLRRFIGNVLDPKRESQFSEVDRKAAKQINAWLDTLAPASTAATGAKSKIDDFGEKIEGARKDAVNIFSDALAAKIDTTIEPLSKAFPQPDYQKLSAAGIPNKALALIAVMRDSIPAKPRRGWKVKAWAEEVDTARRRSSVLLSHPTETGRIELQLFDGNVRERYAADTAAVLEGLAPSDYPAAAKWRLKSASFSVFGGQVFKPAKELYFLEDDRGRMTNIHAANLDDILTPAREAIQARLDEAAGKPGTRRKTPLAVYADRLEKDYFIGFKGASGVVRLKTGFDSPSAARLHMIDHADDLQEQIDGMRIGPKMRRLTNRERVGNSHRDGDVTPEAFAAAFGFRGVQFGNYVEGPRRQLDLNEAFDALMDLAAVLNVPSQALSLNGELGLAFGARGRGGAAKAHYEPSQVVINLTKGKGAGSLAHEWLHAVDNYFAKQDNGQSGAGFMSERKRAAGASRDVVYEAWKKLEKTLTGGSFSARSAEYDKARSKPYWNTMIEKAARAFERYVFDRMAEQGAINDYLANIDTEGGAYPTPAEMGEAGIREAFDNLFQTIETRETKRGVELFSREGEVEPVVVLTGEEIGTPYTGPESMPDLRRAAQRWYNEHLRGTTATMKDGSVVEFSRVGMKESTSGKGHRLLQAVPAIKAIIENGEIVGRTPGTKTDQIENIFVAAPVQIDGEIMTLAVSIRHFPTGKFQYDFGTWREEGSPGVSVPGGPKPKLARHPAIKTAPTFNLFVWDDVFKADFTLANLQKRLKQAGLGHEVALRVVSEIRSAADGGPTRAAGRYMTGLIEIALHARDKGWTLNHEIIHALKDLGLITAGEWRTLARAVRADKARMADVRRRYGKLGLSEDDLVEEAIADSYADWANGETQPGAAVRGLFERIRDFFLALARALTGASFNSAEEIFSAIGRGEMGQRRKNGNGAASSLSPKLATAYHGTPHDFDKFTTDKIGTGEGAQAYGWGLYFAGKKGVADHYRSKLSKGLHRVDGQSVDEWAKGEGLPLAKTMAVAERVARDGVDTAIETYRRLDLPAEMEIAERMRAAEVRAPGHVYKVDIAPEEDQLLDWDKRLEDQSSAVKAALKSIPTEIWAAMDERLESRNMSPISDLDDYTGGELYKLLTDYEVGEVLPAELPGSSWYEGRTSEKQHASMYLKSIGIPGIRYLDGGSRKSGEGTSNYVVFDGKDVAVKEKFSIESKTERTSDLDTYMRGLVGELDSYARTVVSDYVRYMPVEKRVELSAVIEGADDDGAKIKAIADAIGVKITGRATPSNLSKAVKDAYRRLHKEVAEQADERSREEDADFLERMIAEPREPGRKKKARATTTEEMTMVDRVLRRAPKLPDPGDYQAIHRALLHPYQIATKDGEFADVFHWGMEFNRLRNESQVLLGQVMEPYATLSEKQRENINKVLEIGRLEGQDYSADETITARNERHETAAMPVGSSITLTPEEKQGYLSARAMLDRAMLMFKQQVLVEAGLGRAGDPRSPEGIRSFAQSESGELTKGEREALERAADMVETIEKARRVGYVPFSRYGDYSITVTTQDGHVAWFGKVEKVKAGVRKLSEELTAKKVEKLRDALKARFPRSEGFIVQKTRYTPRLEVSGLQDIDFAVLDDMAKRGGADGETVEAYHKAVQAEWTKQGFRAHFVESRNTPGYEQDFTRSLSDYIVGISGYLARRSAMGPMEQAVSRINPQKPNLLQYAKNYKNYIFNPQEEYSQWRSLMFFAYLAGNVSSAALNLTQVPLFTYPFLTMVAHPLKAAASLTNASRLTAKMFRPQKRAEFLNFDVSKAPADLREDLEALMKEGTLVPMVTLENMGVAAGRKKFLRGLGDKQRQVMEIAGTMFTAAERANRISTAVAALRLASDPKVMKNAEEVFKDSKVWQDMAVDGVHSRLDFARFVINETHFLQGKMNRPSALRGGWSVIGQFKGFTMNALQLQNRMKNLYGPEGKKALALNLFLLFIAAGALGLPGADDTKDIIEWIYKFATKADLDVEKEMQELAVDMFGENKGPWIGEAIRRGVLRQAGADMSQRIGMGSILPVPLPEPTYSTLGQTEKQLAIFGLPGAVAATGLRAVSDMMSGDWATAFAEFSRFGLSAGGANLAKALAMKKDGLRSRAGALVMHPDDLTESDLALRAFGFQSTRIARRREQDWMQTRADHAVEELQAHFNQRLARAVAAHDREEIAAVNADIRAWNAGKPAYLKVIITPQGIRRRLRQEKLGQSEARDATAPKKARGEHKAIREIMPAN